MKTFVSPQAFALFLLKLAAKEPEVMRIGLQEVAKLIKKTAKDEIGHYQPASGPFQAWPRLSLATEADKERLGYVYNDDYNPLLREGDLKQSYTYRTSMKEAVIGSDLDEAVYHEFGTEKMPARPVLGPAAFRNKEKIRAIFGTEVMIGLFGAGITRNIINENPYM